MKTLLRDAVVLSGAIILAFVLDKTFNIIERGIMSEDIAQDTFAWTALVALSIVCLFLLWFALEGVFFVPYKLWKERSGRIANLRDTELALGAEYRTSEVPGLDGPAVEWEDAAWAILAEAKKSPKPEFATGHAKTLSGQIGWTMMLIKHMSDGALLPLYAVYKNCRLGEKVWQGTDRRYFVNKDNRTLIRFDQNGVPWSVSDEVEDFDAVFVLERDLRTILRKISDGTIEQDLDEIANLPDPDDGIDETMERE
ncbi:hypothetical protein [Hyphomonas sp. KY3]|uniref:hypothetical protein n=1 Tax=Hyphomonas sp. KY3 TaxID=2016196 RepID=UPI001A8CD903|nr:hypothetical protein [Hyphomonas sp. KY3]